MHLIMDNAGGHGTKDAIDECVLALKNDHNVIVTHRIPRSPETNLLDLGVWFSLQSAVEKNHRHMRIDNIDSLVNTCNATWESCNSDVFQKVCDRWIKVLDIITSDYGDNKLVDAHRKELFVLQLAMPRPLVVDEEEAAGESDDDEIDSW